MAIIITSAIKTESFQWAVTVTLTSYDVIADPAGYISSSSVIQAEVISRAGLSSDIVFIAATLESSSLVGLKRQYVLTVTFGDALTAGGHTHDCSTVTYPLQCGYAAGPTIALNSTLGPIILSRDVAADMTYLQLKDLNGDLFKVTDTVLRIGRHVEFHADATYDLGTPDAGVTLRRPRDVRLSRDLYVGRNSTFGGSGIFSSYVKNTYNSLTPQAVNPSTGAGVRHIYNSSVDNALHYWDGAVDHIVGSPSGSDTVGVWNCDAAVQQYDVVFCDSSDHVNQASAVTLAGREIVGICIEKITATQARIRYTGEIAGFSGLVAGSAYFVSTAAGALINSIAGFTTGYTAIQVGIAKNATTLVYQPGDPSVI